MPIWGIDLGGTKIEGVILKSAEEPEVLLRERIATEADQGYDHIIGRISLLISQMKEQSGLAPEKIGIGTPGAMDPITGAMKNSNTTSLNDRPFFDDLQTKLGFPVKMANDANCFALAEARMGIVRDKLPDAQVVFGVIMGTGVGGGLVIDGRVINGRQGIAGEWGHNFLDESGGVCYCGKVGCVERVISGKNLERYHFETFGKQVKLKDLYQRHLTGQDEQASHTINRLLTQFGKALAVVINILDPDAIVLGGGVGNIDLLYTEGIQEIKKHVFNTTLDTVILKPKLGDSAGVFGAAFLVA
ncbi:MAG: ROK family protein [Cyclobacteriaceae bacterium]|nr:ROK family protein [Cyclobacteriaceae bacterium HetDA_MAG_MS6]